MATKTITTRGTMSLTGSPTVDVVTLSTTRKTNIVITYITGSGLVYVTAGGSDVANPTQGTSDEFVLIPSSLGFKVTIPMDSTITTLKLISSTSSARVHIQVN